MRLAVKSKGRKWGEESKESRKRGAAAVKLPQSRSREKSKTKTSPFGLVFVFREIIEFKFKRVYLRSFFTFGICRRFIETSESDAI